MSKRILILIRREGQKEMERHTYTQDREPTSFVVDDEALRIKDVPTGDRTQPRGKGREQEGARGQGGERVAKGEEDQESPLAPSFLHSHPYPSPSLASLSLLLPCLALLLFASLRVRHGGIDHVRYLDPCSLRLFAQGSSPHREDPCF